MKIMEPADNSYEETLLNQSLVTPSVGHLQIVAGTLHAHQITRTSLQSHLMSNRDS